MHTVLDRLTLILCCKGIPFELSLGYVPPVSEQICKTVIFHASLSSAKTSGTYANFPATLQNKSLLILGLIMLKILVKKK